MEVHGLFVVKIERILWTQSTICGRGVAKIAILDVSSRSLWTSAVVAAHRGETVGSGNVNRFQSFKVVDRVIESNIWVLVVLSHGVFSLEIVSVVERDGWSDRKFVVFAYGGKLQLALLFNSGILLDLSFLDATSVLSLIGFTVSVAVFLS